MESSFAKHHKISFVTNDNAFNWNRLEKMNASNLEKVPSCTSCQEIISESYLLKVDNQYWHEDCLRCNCCNCRLGEVGSSLYARADLLLCKRDYLRMFGSIGYCNVCDKVIPAFELVMRAGSFVYHLECFGCQECNHRFCVGDKCYLYGNRILCEADYEEIMLYNKIASQIPLTSSFIF